MSPLQHLLILFVRIYRWTLSPLLVALFGAQCRYQPSCSVYAIEAVRRHGGLRGGRLVLGRLARCQPWGGCGCDPVPDVNLSRVLNH